MVNFVAAALPSSEISSLSKSRKTDITALTTLRFFALAISAVAHASLLGWALARQVSPGLAGTERHSSQPLRVSLLSSEKDYGNEPVTKTSSAAEKRETPPAVSGSSARGGFSTYYPAKAISRMPEAITNFEPHLPASEDNGTGGKLSMRLWINESGSLDRLSVLSSELPETFENAALAAFKQMRFRPGEIEGVAVKVWLDVVIEYADLRK
jgi:TonB family protein